MLKHGIKFIFKSGNFVEAVMSESEAQRIYADWTSKAYKLKDDRVVGKRTQEGFWAVDLDEVAGMHSFAFQEQTPLPAVPPHVVSGVNQQWGR